MCEKPGALGVCFMVLVSVKQEKLFVPHGREVPADVTEMLRAMRTPVVMSHVVPDADALGSMIGVALAMASPTCVPKISLPEGSVSQRLRFLVDGGPTPPVATAEDFAAADGFVALDTAKKPRCNVGPALKDADWSSGRPIVNIDHHTSNTLFGDTNWVVGEACSTCEMVYYMLVAEQRPIDARIASLLFAGIQTDTIGFSLPTAGAPAFQAAAALTAAGADVGDLGERLCRSQTKSEFDLLRVIYANTRTAANGQLAYSSATHDEISSAGCTAADIDDQINVPRSLDGARLAILFTEGTQGQTRMNFRGAGAVTVVELAGEFGGGGHSQAAGAILDGGVEEAMRQVLPAAEAHLKKFPSGS